MSVSFLIFAAAILILAATVWIFYAKLKEWFRALFGADSLRSLIESREEAERTVPRSLSGATELYLPQLRKDFPELNWAEFKAGAEQALTKALQEEGAKEILIHRTVLSAYRRYKGTCTAELCSAVQYLADGRLTQDRRTVTMAYVQDADKAGYENGVSLTCPSCGAPVKSLGEKHCAYCGAAIREINMRVWRVMGVKKS